MNKPDRDEVFHPILHDENYFEEWFNNASYDTREKSIVSYVDEIEEIVGEMSNAESYEELSDCAYVLVEFSNILAEMTSPLDEFPDSFPEVSTYVH